MDIILSVTSEDLAQAGMSEDQILQAVESCLAGGNVPVPVHVALAPKVDVVFEGFIMSEWDRLHNRTKYMFVHTDMSAYGYLMVCPYKRRFTFPPGYSGTAEAIKSIKSIKAQQDRLRETYSREFERLESALQDLLCTAHETSPKPSQEK